ncbi:hypothetical protein [Acinetobacter haemolyticus]|uniref:Uncharacterized protein n=1 Tax=Acinetobacter haemolyticus TaxID=29430 RepID=A0AAJ3D932_ACIHA|nr:hypothetical protein [Acinetobacter haemolyticus]NAR73915.1 hypothetical protein [Acinetobacter haemolyticus]NCU23935.1 hypothetical protein [Acinetobacter haemolyticus]
MDISEAASTHLRDFSDFHIDLNKYVKLSVVALNHLFDSTGDPKELSDLISELIKGAGERWAATNYVDPHGEIEDLKFQLTESALMRVYSSFEVFLDEISGSYSEYKLKNPEPIDSAAYGATALKLFSAFGWDTKKIEYLLPVYHFYNIARHCVVHRMGKANKELIELSASSDFLEAIENWPTVIPGNQLSPPPTININKKIDLRPHHAITYSDVCYRLASEINKKLIEMVGYEYIVKSVAIERILKRDSLDYPPCKDAYHYLRYILNKEYKLKGVEFHLIKAVLEKEGIRQKCYQKHASMLALA